MTFTTRIDSDNSKAIEHYGVPRYFRRAYPNILGRMTSDSYRVDNKGGKQPLAVDLYNALFAHSDGAMENGVGYIQLVRTPHWWTLRSYH
jgi:hypothetical protein